MELVAFCLSIDPIARKKVSLKELVECPLVLRGGGRLKKLLMNLGYNRRRSCTVAAPARNALRLADFRQITLVVGPHESAGTRR
jgi:hypothetical protein